MLGGRRYSSCIEATKNLLISRDYRLIYAMRGFPYTEFQLELLSCLDTAARKKQENLLTLSEDLTLDYETRVCEEFRVRFLNEEATEFTDGTKFEEVSKYIDIFSSIFAAVKSNVLQQLTSKSNANIAKLEADSTELITTLVKYISLAFDRVIREITQPPKQQQEQLQRQQTLEEGASATVAAALSTQTAVKLHAAIANFFKVNVSNLEAESEQLIAQLKNFLIALAGPQQSAASRLVDLFPYRAIFSKGFFKRSLRDFLVEKTLCDTCFAGVRASTYSKVSVSGRILLVLCDFQLKVLLHFNDEERLLKLAEVISSQVRSHNLQLTNFPAVNMTLNALIRKFGDALQHS